LFVCFLSLLLPSTNITKDINEHEVACRKSGLLQDIHWYSRFDQQRN
jgi:hypothetical protein